MSDDMFSRDNKVWVKSEDWNGLKNGLKISFWFMNRILDTDEVDFVGGRGKKKTQEDEFVPENTLSLGLQSGFSMEL